MGDALSAGVSFEYLDQEIIGAAISEAGERHVWLWLTKRPERMAELGIWLLEHGGYWPENLVAMTTVTSQRHAWRAEALRKVPATCRGLSLEPLLEPVRLDLKGIDWLIAGGGSDVLAQPLNMACVQRLRSQCADSGVAFFVKQLGRAPVFPGASLKLKDSHGGDWSEWPSEWRVRQMPEQFYRLGSQGYTNENRGRTSTAD
jgi:protein gp37